MTKQIITLIAVTTIAIISGCAARPVVDTTPIQVVEVVEEEVEVVRITVYADSLNEAREQAASAGYELQGNLQSVRQLASDSVRVPGWRQGAFIGEVRVR